MSKREFAQREQREIDAKRNTGEGLTTADMVAAAENAPAERQREVNLQVPSARPMSRQPDAWSEEGTAPLFDQGEAEEFRSRWNTIQTGFVDEPHRAVEQADELVAAAMKRLAGIFADERANLEREWANGEDVSTEDLRIALRRYRSFFDRLLSV